MESNIDINIDSFESEECAICLEDIVSDSMTILDCGHVLHTDCLLLYANHRIRNTYTSIPCPVCRHPLLSENDLQEEDQPQENTEDTFELESNDTVVHFRRRPNTVNPGNTFRIIFWCTCFCTSLSIFMYIFTYMLDNRIFDSDLSSDK